MSLCPRYSLLTLLVLTALIAGGVKFWYGPHRVVERVSNTEENEYTFTRDWKGNRIIDGPHYCRNFDAEKGNLNYVLMKYFHSGIETGHEQELWIVEPGRSISSYLVRIEYLQLSDFEKAEFQETINQEVERIQNLGLKVSISNYYEVYNVDTKKYQRLD